MAVPAAASETKAVAPVDPVAAAEGSTVTTVVSAGTAGAIDVAAVVSVGEVPVVRPVEAIAHIACTPVARDPFTGILRQAGCRSDWVPWRALIQGSVVNCARSLTMRRRVRVGERFSSA